MDFKSEHGNVLVYILIAVALFAALGFAVSNMMRSGGSSIGAEKQGVSASEVLSFSKSMRDGVQLMHISNGCSDVQISLERSPFDGSDTNYVNASSPADFSCHVFHPDGGGVSYQLMSSNINGGADWIFTGANDGKDIGSECVTDDCADLIAILPGVPVELCRAINKQLGIANSNNYLTQEDNSFEEDFFQGSYTYEAQLSDDSGLNALEGRYQGCFEGQDSPQSAGVYYFYQVLLAR